MFIKADIENTPLKIKTDSSLDSDEKVSLSFYTSGGDSAGGVFLHFTSPPQYELDFCAPRTNFSTALPTDTNKVWRITRTRTSGIRLVIHCNEVEVLNVLLSDSSCRNFEWSYIWSRKVEKFKFNGNDLASDYYTGLVALDNSRSQNQKDLVVLSRQCCLFCLLKT